MIERGTDLKRAKLKLKAAEKRLKQLKEDRRTNSGFGGAAKGSGAEGEVSTTHNPSQSHNPDLFSSF